MTLTSVRSTIKWLEENPDGADVIFMDVELSDGICFEIFERVNINAHVVITTAYDNYAISAFKVNTRDYLLKPISFEVFERAAVKAQSLAQLLSLRDSAKSEDIPACEQSSEKECISVRADHKTTLVRYSNIIYLESAGEYVRLHLADGSKLVTLFRLKNMESTLPAERFVRVHRSFIVNLEHITGYTKGRVFLSGGEYVPIGENYKEAFAAITQRLG
jgi:two-component system LytT family response regulator